MDKYNYILVEQYGESVAILKVEAGSPEELKAFELMMDKGFKLKRSSKKDYDALVDSSDSFVELDIDDIDEIEFEP